MSAKQSELNLYLGQWGGRRPGSGRKRIHSKGVAHRTREIINSRTPLHINFRFKTFIRNKESLRLLKRAIVNARAHGLKIIHFSLQSNHVHFIIEAKDNTVLTKGMRSLTITFAKGLKKGRVQIERYHLHVLKSIRETRNAVMYVLFNQQKHDRGICSEISSYSSILSMDNCLKIISKFSKEHRQTIKVARFKRWEGDSSTSYVLKRAIREISTF